METSVGQASKRLVSNVDTMASSSTREDSTAEEGMVNSEENKARFLDLPWQDVIFSHIFHYLPLSDITRCRQISRLFNELCLNFFKTCQDLDFSIVANSITEEAFVQITITTSRLKNLNLENCRSIKNESLMDVLQRNSQLMRLNVSGCNSLSNQCLVSIAKHCSRLCQLYLKECRWVSPEGIINLAVSCRTLQVVDLSGCWEVNDDCLTVLVKSCPSISELSINGCYGITDLSLHVISHHLSELTRLELNGCWRITNHAIRLVGEYCHSLQYLKVKDCRDISEASLARLRVQGVDINVKPIVSASSVLNSMFNRSAMHMTPFFSFDPS